jgi:hypothetical protein
VGADGWLVAMLLVAGGWRPVGEEKDLDEGMDLREKGF